MLQLAPAADGTPLYPAILMLDQRSRAQAAEGTLQGNINAEATARIAAITAGARSPRSHW